MHRHADLRASDSQLAAGAFWPIVVIGDCKWLNSLSEARYGLSEQYELVGCFVPRLPDYDCE
jgi:hypothetical protein